MKKLDELDPKPATASGRFLYVCFQVKQAGRVTGVVLDKKKLRELVTILIDDSEVR